MLKRKEALDWNPGDRLLLNSKKIGDFYKSQIKMKINKPQSESNGERENELL